MAVGVERWGQRAGELAALLKKHPVAVSRWVSDAARQRREEPVFGDMMDELGVFPHNLATSSPTFDNRLVYVLTSNGVDEAHKVLPVPDAPSFLAVDKKLDVINAGLSVRQLNQFLGQVYANETLVGKARRQLRQVVAVAGTDIQHVLGR